MAASLFTAKCPSPSPSALLPIRFGDSRHFSFFSKSFKPIHTHSFAVKCCASSSSASILETSSVKGPILVEKEVGGAKNILACPVCYDPLSVDSASGSSLQCNTCKKAYSGIEPYHDLMISSGPKDCGESRPIVTELFRLPLISFLYERGWRQNFKWAGFPGPEKEFEMIKGYLEPVLGGNILDASCGSGLFSRIFAQSGLFSSVIALDFSENMLKQCHDFVNQEGNFPKENLTLVRADISRLPLVSSSVDAVHAGAALHCWPSPVTAVAEISRVLRPGGVFVATTAIFDGLFASMPISKIIRENLSTVSGTQIFLSEKELEDVCKACGLVDFTCYRNGPFVMLSAKKPS